MAIYGLQPDILANPNKNVSLYVPGQTQLTAGDVFLGGPGTGVTDEMVGQATRVYGDDANGTALALDHYNNSKPGSIIPPQAGSVSKTYGLQADVNANPGKNVNLYTPGQTQLTAQDVFLGGEGTGVSNSALHGAIRLAGNTAQDTSKAYDNYSQDLASQIKAAQANLSAPRADANMGTPTMARLQLEAQMGQNSVANNLAQKTYDHGVTQDAFNNEYKVGDMMGNYQGNKTLAQRAQDIQGAQFNASLASNESQFGRKLTADESQFGRSLAIQKQNANTSAGIAPVSSPTTVPTDFWDAAVNAGNASGVDPTLLAAIAQHETGYGTLGAGRDGFSLGVGVYDAGNPNSNYQDSPGSYTKQLQWAANSIANKFSGNVSLESIKAYQKASGYATDPNWANGVWDAYQKINNSLSSPGKGKQTAGQKTDAATSDAMDFLNELANQGKTKTQIMQSLNNNSGRFEGAGVNTSALRTWADKTFQWNG